MSASPYRWIVLAVAVVGFVQTHVHRMAFAPLIPTFVGDLGLTYAAAGTIQTAYFWTYALAQIPVGMVADRWGSRRVMIGCMALLAVGAVAFAASRTYAESIAARCLVGFGAAAVWVPGMRLIAEWFPVAERGRATGLMSGGGGVGGTLGLILIPWLAAMWGWRVAYGALALPALLTLLFIVLALPRDARAAATTARRSGSLGRVLAHRGMWPLNLSVTFSYGGYFSFVTFLPAFLVKRLALSDTQAGVITGLITAGTILSWPLAGALSDRVGRRKPIYIASQCASVLVCFSFALGESWMGAASASMAAVVAGILIGGLILPFVMVSEMFPRDLAATAAGVANSACFVGAMILPIALGRVLDVTGSFAAAFVVAGAVQMVACVFGAFMAETGATRYTPERS
jgi:ACS family D-galactonate transporter-like MFS transporter